MELIERYIYAVKTKLNKKVAIEIEEELRNNIEEMLENDYSEENIIKVLTQMGNPIEVADEYRNEKRYLIGPKYFDNYLNTLKIVGIVLLCVFPILAVVSNIFQKDLMVADLIENIIIDAFDMLSQGILKAFCLITIIFYLIEKSQKDKKLTWDVKALPKVPKVKIDKRSVGNLVGGLILFLFEIIFLLTFKKWNIIYFTDTIKLFNESVIKSFTYLLLSVFILELLLNIWNFTKKYRLQYLITKIIFSLFSIAVSYSLIVSNQIISNEFINQILVPQNIDLNAFNTIFKFTIVIIIIVYVNECVMTTRQYLKSR